MPGAVVIGAFDVAPTDDPAGATPESVGIVTPVLRRFRLARGVQDPLEVDGSGE